MQKDTVEVIINKVKEGVLTCTTSNPFGENAPHWESPKWDQWQQAESERRTYEIVNGKNLCSCASEDKECIFPDCLNYVIGEKYKAQIINNKAVIL